jgi:hypothetical protein
MSVSAFSSGVSFFHGWPPLINGKPFLYRQAKLVPRAEAGPNQKYGIFHNCRNRALHARRIRLSNKFGKREHPQARRFVDLFRTGKTSRRIRLQKSRSKFGTLVHEGNCVLY